MMSLCVHMSGIHEVRSAGSGGVGNGGVQPSDPTNDGETTRERDRPAPLQAVGRRVDPQTPRVLLQWAALDAGVTPHEALAAVAGHRRGGAAVGGRPGHVISPVISVYYKSSKTHELE